VSAKPERRGQRFEQRCVAAGAPAEPVIEPDHDLSSPERSDENVLHERLRLDAGDGRSERDHHGGVDPGLGDEREPFLERRDRKRSAIRLQHLHRVAVEGARERPELAASRMRHRRPQNGAMAEVDAVEGAERDGARSRVRREGFESADDLHAGCGRA